MNALCKMIVVLLLTAGTTAGAAGDPQLKKLRLPAQARVGDVEAGAPAQFEIACHGAKDGALSVSLILSSPDAIKSFPLRDFEGPDGVGETRELARWGIDTRGSAVQATGAISGWYGVDGDGFLLSRSQSSRKGGALATIVAEAGKPDAKRLRLSIAAPKGGDPLQAQALLDGRQADIAAVAKDCLPK